jgi:hypothetical protein
VIGHRPGCHRHRRPVRRPDTELPPAHRQRTRPDPQTPAARGQSPPRQPGQGGRACDRGRAQGAGGQPAQGLVREDQHPARPLLRPHPVREAEHHKHDPLREGNRGAARPEGGSEVRPEPGDPRPGPGPAPAVHRTQGPRPRRGRSRPPHESAVQCLLGAPPTPFRQWGRIDENSRKSQAGFVCSSCGFTCNADTDASINVAAGQGGIPRPRRTAGAGGTTPPTKRPSVREPQPIRAGIPLFQEGEDVKRSTS